MTWSDPHFERIIIGCSGKCIEGSALAVGVVLVKGGDGMAKGVRSGAGMLSRCERVLGT